MPDVKKITTALPNFYNLFIETSPEFFHYAALEQVTWHNPTYSKVIVPRQDCK